jgi:hypothetical protein
MVYVTICKECSAEDHENCGLSLKPEKDWLARYNETHEDFACGGGMCLCKHGMTESEWIKSVRENVQQRAKEYDEARKNSRHLPG